MPSVNMRELGALCTKGGNISILGSCDAKYSDK